MCGRFTQAYTWEEIREAMSLLGRAPGNMRPRFNVAPTTMVDDEPRPQLRALENGEVLGVSIWWERVLLRSSTRRRWRCASGPGEGLGNAEAG